MTIVAAHFYALPNYVATCSTRTHTRTRVVWAYLEHGGGPVLLFRVLRLLGGSLVFMITVSGKVHGMGQHWKSTKQAAAYKALAARAFLG